MSFEGGMPTIERLPEQVLAKRERFFDDLEKQINAVKIQLGKINEKTPSDSTSVIHVFALMSAVSRLCEQEIANKEGEKFSDSGEYLYNVKAVGEKYDELKVIFAKKGSGFTVHDLLSQLSVQEKSENGGRFGLMKEFMEKMKSEQN